MDLIVAPTAPQDSELVVKWIAFDRGFGTAFNRPPEDHVSSVRLEGTRAEPSRDAARAARPYPALATDGATQIDLSLTPVSTNSVARSASTASRTRTREPLMADVGETQVWTVTNTIDFAHPFHCHGFFFQVLSPRRPLEWKDTVDCSGRTARPLRRPLRRSSRHVDVPLSHTRPCRRR
jgi:FtsP/CotA-like multicopper oxidase with cupredoxin domain